MRYCGTLIERVGNFMKIKKKLVSTLAGLVAITSVFAVTPSYAYGHYYPHYHHHYHHGGGLLVAGLVFGTALGMMAGAAASHDYACRQVTYVRHCRYNPWYGDRTCYVERYVHYVC
ncbi:hypothetical protein [Coxiella burnetii]|uniref:Hypothetical exported protein n=2 Tax=Coxiella burnetii TaxID=777 RepID=Q83C34_COXBU|nr:hypothetical protein [Coxiella burnetii]NP_820292.1 hypothetical protein CBU_1300 [Coxiella burnetii RSA 493]AAO90806.1 hypothetical exported protein [Coxiella burnetii RSA 493]AML48832.1 hypothetical protein AUR58_06330 [Coxiella burnetii]AML54796.1 hypothetical protein AYM38_05630 [Coxiella burnetii]ARI66090.1 hypothetical protein B7L74_06700 [Coxiella burnetii]ARK27554.1 hypothetical protein BMW92_06515 [Coxiella burnetii]